MLKKYTASMKPEDITLIDLCYRYGASPAAQSLVGVPLLSTRKFDPRWIEMGEPRDDLIELMRYQRGSTSDIVKEPRPSQFWLWHDRLTFYSLLMLAQYTQAISGDLPEEFIEAAKREFGDYPPGRYAESGFPLAAAFLLRIHRQYEETASTNISKLFHRLLAFDASVRTDQWMLRVYWIASLPSPVLDDRNRSVFAWDGQEPASLLNFRNFRLTHIQRFDPLETCLSFLRFCNDLYSLLSGIEDRTVAGLIRHYYAHILDVFHDQRTSPLSDGLSVAINRLILSAQENKAEEDMKELTSLATRWVDVTNHERWPLPAKLVPLLTDPQTQPESQILPTL